jgi:hypothetical protein
MSATADAPLPDRAELMIRNDWLLAEVKRQEVEIERLRDALRDVATTAHCISKAGPLHTKTLAEAWNKFDHISVKATGAIKPP